MRLSVAMLLCASALLLGRPLPAKGADCPPNMISVSYYTGQELLGSPADDSCRPLKGGVFQISEDWGNTGPTFCVQDCPGKTDRAQQPRPVYRTFADNFSVRFRLQPTFQAGNYEFTVNADDGVRLRVDGELLVDDWSIHAAVERRVGRTMTAGRHEVIVEYFEASQRAIVQVGWRQVP